MYPAYYQRQIDIQNYYNEPDPDVKIERNLRTMYSQDPVPLPKTPVDLIEDGYDPDPNIPIYTSVAKENTSYMLPILIVVLLIILFLIFR
jgi:hypothetical protein